MTQRPSRPPLRQPAPSRPQRQPAGFVAQVRDFSRYISRLGRAQLILGTIAVLVVCSMIGGTLLTILVDVTDTTNGNGNDNESNFTEEQSQLIEEQRQYVSEHPDDADGMALLAQFLALDGNLSEAITWFERALEINPNTVDIRLNFADTLSQGRRYADAELQYKRVLEIDPNNLQATFYLGDLYQFWQPTPRYAEAALQYQKVIAMAPDSVLAQRASQQLVVMGYATPVPATPIAGATPALPIASNATGS